MTRKAGVCEKHGFVEITPSSASQADVLCCKKCLEEFRVLILEQLDRPGGQRIPVYGDLRLVGKDEK